MSAVSGMPAKAGTPVAADTPGTISTRNIAMNIYEALMTRDENNNPILELAESLTEAPDHLSYTFKLRDGIVFHNGKKMTSADVAASFDRYAKVGSLRSILGNVAGWDAPDPLTFVIRMKLAQPTFIESLSSFSVPIVIIPAFAVPSSILLHALSLRQLRRRASRAEAARPVAAPALA